MFYSQKISALRHLSKKDLYNEINQSCEKYCDCCDCYYDDEDYEYYESELWDDFTDFVNASQVNFYNNIHKLGIFTEEFIKRIRDGLIPVVFSDLNVSMDFEISDISSSSCDWFSNYLKVVFEENNKYDIKLRLSLDFKSTEFNKIRYISVKIDENFFINEDRYYRKVKNSLFWIFSQKCINKIPPFCKSNEDCLIYYMYSNHHLVLDGTFSIEDIISDYNYYELFKMSII